MIKEALRPNFWRPVTDNDMGNDMNKTLRPWREAGRGAKLTSLEKTALDKDGYEVVSHYRLPEEVAVRNSLSATASHREAASM